MVTQRDDFVRCAREQVGKRYVWATAGPDTFDCSGLVAYCYKQATSKEITHSSCDQINLGTWLIGPHREPGDLEFWGNDSECPDHVGINVGKGRIVNALNEQRGVVDTPLAGEYGLPYIGTKRIFLPDDSPIVENPAPMEEKPNPKLPGRNKRHRRHLRREGKL